MRPPGFVWGSYEAQSLTADGQRTMNWYPEPITSAGAPTTASFFPTPGVSSLSEPTRRSV